MAGLTIDNPIRFVEAIKSERVIPGDTLILMPGTYTAMEKGVISGRDIAGKGVFQIKLNGESGKPITIKPYTKGTVRINGGVELIDASYVTIQDIEIAPTPTTRSFPTGYDMDFPLSLYITAPGCKILNNHIHNGQQIGIYGTGGCDVLGNVIGAMGYYTADQDRNRNYNIYTHNNTYGLVNIQNNAFYAPFGSWSICMWSASSNNVWGYRALNNVIINGGVIVASDAGLLQDNKVNDNICYNNREQDSHFAMNYYGVAGNRDFEALRNYIVLRSGSVMIKNSLLPTFKNNTIVAPAGSDWRPMLYLSEDGVSVIDIDENAYYNASEEWANFADRIGIYNTIEDWRTATGFDLNSTYTKGSMPADSVVVKAMSDTRWSVSVFNYTAQNSVSVDMSAYVTEACIVRNLQDFKNDYFAWDGTGNLVLDMVNRTHAEPTAFDSPNPYAPTTFPTFGCFIVDLV